MCSIFIFIQHTQEMTEEQNSKMWGAVDFSRSFYMQMTNSETDCKDTF